MRSNIFFTTSLLLGLWLSLVPLQGQSQPETTKQVTSGFDLVSNYLWRGMLLSPGPAVQPYLSFSFHRFTLGAESSVSLRPFAWQETDLSLEYAWEWLTLGFNDYFIFNDSSMHPGCLDFGSNSTSHVLEFTASFNGTEKIPFRLLAGYNIYGDDPSQSIYIEGAWMKSTPEGEWEVFCGYTPHEGYYHESRKGLTHIGTAFTRELISHDKFSLPMQISLQYLPMLQQVFLTASIGIY